MALLAAIDISDDGTLKIERFTQVLEALGASVRKNAEDVTKAGRETKKSTDDQFDAIARLAAEQRKQQQETLRQAQNTLQMATAFKAGTVVTKEMLDAVELLNKHMALNNSLSVQQKAAMAALSTSMQQGTVVTQGQAAALQRAAQAQAQSIVQSQGLTRASIGSQVATLIQSAAFLTAAASIRSYAEESFRVAARNEVLSTSIQIIAKNSNQSAVAFEEQVQSIRRLGITTTEARDAVINFAQANLSLTDAAKLARAAQNLAAVAGTNSSDAFNSMSTAIQRQAPILLRQFGIIENLDITYAKYARTIGKTSSELETHEKRQAILNLILAQSEKVSGAYEASMANVGKSMGSTARFVEELQNKFGQGFLPVMKIVIDTMNETLGSLAKLPDGVFIAAASLATLIGVLASVAGALAALKLAGIGAGLAALTGPIGWVALALGVLAAGTVAYTAATNVSIQSMTEQLAAASASATRFEEQKTAVDKAAEALKQHTDIGTIPGQLAQQKLNSEVEKLHRMAPGVVESWGDMSGAVQYNTDKLKENRAELQARIDAQVRLHEAEVRQAESRLAEVREQIRHGEQRAAGPQGFTVVDAAGSATFVLEPDQKKAQDAAILAMANLYAEADALESKINTLGGNIANMTVAGISQLITQEINTLQAKYKNFDEVAAKAGTSLAAMMKLAAQDGDVNAMKAKRVELEKLANDLDAANTKIEKNTEAWQKRYTDLLDKLRGTDKLAGADYAALNTALVEVRGNTEEYNKRVLMSADVLEKFSRQTADTKANHQELSAALSALPLIQMQQKFGALETELGKIARDTDEYTQFLLRNKGAIEGINSATPEMAARFKNVMTAAEDLKGLKLHDELKKWTEAAKDFDTTVGSKMETRFATIADGMAEASRSFTEQMILDKHQQVQTFQKYDDELDAHNQALFRNSYEQQVAKNDQWLAKFRAGIEEEILLIRKKEEDTEAAINRRYEQQVRAFDREMDLLEMKYKIIPEAETQFQKLLTAIQNDEGQEQIDAIKRGLVERLDGYREAGVKLFQQERDEARARLDEQSANNTLYIDGLRERGDRAVEAHAASNSVIRRDADFTYNFLSQQVGNYTSTIVNGLGEVLSRTRTFKDLFIEIWVDIKNSLTSLFNDIFTSFTRGLLGLGASGQSGLAGGMAGLKSIGLLNRGGTPAWQGPVQEGMTAPWATAGGGGYASGSMSASLLPGLAGGGIGALGGVAGNLIGERFWGRGGRSTTLGTAMGAGTGFVAGGLMAGIGAGTAWGGAAGPIGAAIGGLAGLGMGLYRARQNQTKGTRNEFLEELGFKDLEELREYMTQNGRAAEGDRLFNQAANVIGRHDTEANIKWMKDVEDSLRKIGTSEAWDELVKGAGSADALNQQMKMVGMSMASLKLAVDAGDIEAVKTQTEELNDRLERQQRLLTALGAAGQGLKTWSTGFVQNVSRGLQEIFDSLGSTDEKYQTPEGRGERDIFNEKYEDYQEKGGELGELAYMVQNSQQFKGDYAPETLERLNKLTADAQAEFNRMGAVASGVFAGIVSQTGDLVQAMNAIAPSLDDMIEAMDVLGLEADGAFGVLIGFRKVIKENEDVANSLSGITQVLNALTPVGFLTKEMFDGLAGSATAQFDILTERGVDANSKMMMMQPTLQALWEAQEKFGFEADAATEALINQAREAGIVGPDVKDVQDKILEVLVKIELSLGRMIDTLFPQMGGSAEDGAGKAAGAVGTIITEVDELDSKLRNLPWPSGNDIGAEEMNPTHPNWPGNNPDGPPSMANEGYAPRPMYALIGDYPGGEVVLHKDRYETLLDAAEQGFGRNWDDDGDGGGRGTSTVIIEADGKTMARIVVPHIPGETQRYGLVRS